MTAYRSGLKRANTWAIDKGARRGFTLASTFAEGSRILGRDRRTVATRAEGWYADVADLKAALAEENHMVSPPAGAGGGATGEKEPYGSGLGSATEADIPYGSKKPYASCRPTP